MLPEGFEIRSEVPTTINVAPIPAGIQDTIEKALDKKPSSAYDRDLAHILSKEHLQHLHSTFLGSRGTHQGTKDRHPGWERAADAIKDPSSSPPKAPEGLSTTITEALGEFATEVGNLWNGSIYYKSVDYLLRILLRLYLAPKRELKYKERTKSMARQKQEAVSKQSSTNRRASQRKLKKLCDDLSDVLESGNNERIARRVPALLGLLVRVQNQKPQPSSPQDVYPYNQPFQSAAIEEIPTGPVPRPDEAEEMIPRHNQHDENMEDVWVDEHDGDVLFGDISEEEGNDIWFKLAPYLCMFSEWTAANMTMLCNVEDTTKEPSRSRLKSLQAVLKMLLESPCIDKKIDEEYIRNACHSGNDFTTDQCQVVAKLANLLSPFIPKRRPKSDGNGTQDPISHVALRVPLVMISNAVLRIAGYHEFTRKLAPEISPSSLHALALGAVGIYDVLCSGGPNQFDVSSVHGPPLTQRQQVTTIPGNKRAIMGAFFDMATIDELCHKHGLEFQNRITYVDRYSVYLLGNTIPNGQTIGEGPKHRTGHPVRSQLDQRRKNQRGRPARDKWSDLGAALNVDKEQAKRNAEDTQNQMKRMESLVQPMKKRLGTLQAAQTAARQDYNGNRNTEAYQALRQARTEVRELRRELDVPDVTLKQLRKETYKWNKIARAPISIRNQQTWNPATIAMTTPTWEWRTIEDDVKHVDISELISKRIQGRQTLVFSGTDYGIRTMSETVPMTEDQFKDYLNYFRKQSDTTVQVPARLRHIPKSNRITAKQINDISHSRRMGKRREGRLKKAENDEARKALAEISTNAHSLARAATKEDIETAHRARTNTRDALRSFETSKKRQKDLHTQRLRTNRAWTKVGAAERGRIQNHGVNAPPRKSPRNTSTSTTIGIIVTANARFPLLALSRSLTDRWILFPVPETSRNVNIRKQTIWTSQYLSKE
ncbi:hypothetical protein BGZ65_000194 [Modicella reniformis]|uniref:Uncharacterized protein n=1 Tax=Modicella reniformis TaxID=1440133 RepID=A0A9P6M133_9FUNG|nr:hypothetical protein BGZ65_000194 [Modicella reniformis]